jgi:hypothetical protein
MALSDVFFRQLKRSYQILTVVPVTKINVATNKMPIFTNAEYTDMHFVYGFCHENSLAAFREYHIWIGGNLTDVYYKECFMM